MPDTPIGTNSPDYTLVTADLGADIYCKVTATNASGTANADSNTVGPVTAAAGTSSTWNPADRTADAVGEAVAEFSAGNRTITTRFLAGASHYMGVRGTLSHGSGKRYFEAKMNLIPYSGFIGLASSSQTMTDIVSNVPGIDNSFGFACYADHDLAIVTITYGTSGTSYDIVPDVVIAVNGVLGFAIDFDTRTAYFRYNGTWMGPGDPVAGTGGLSWGATPTSLFPYCMSVAGGSDPEAITTIATQDAHFLNAPPTGFTAWG